MQDIKWELSTYDREMEEFREDWKRGREGGGRKAYSLFLSQLFAIDSSSSLHFLTVIVYVH